MSSQENRNEHTALLAKRVQDKPAEQARPLADEIEEEMRDQDIPVETGIRRGADKRSK